MKCLVHKVQFAQGGRSIGSPLACSTAYQSRKCRCANCVQANREYFAARGPAKRDPALKKQWREGRRFVGIYALLDPRDGAVRYVGKTTQSLADRLNGHENDKGRRSPDAAFSARKKWILELRSLGLRPQIVGLERTSRSGLNAAEGRWVVGLGKAGHDLLNEGWDWLSPSIDINSVPVVLVG